MTYRSNFLAHGLLVIDEAFFGRVFDWRKTPEGREFWKGIDKKWWDLYLAR